MSRKKSQPKKDIVPDPKFNSTFFNQLINCWHNNILNLGKDSLLLHLVSV